MDISTQAYLQKIKSSGNKKHYRVRNAIKFINTLISEYRLTAMKSYGYIRTFCNSEANYLEKRLEEALK